MKFTLIILSLMFFANFTNAQNNDYDPLWKQVEKQQSEGLPKSALKIVNTIANKAKHEQNYPQFIKALLHKNKYTLTLEEEAQLSIINDFKAEIATAKSPVKNILENILAQLYWHYFQQNRYKFYNRTKTSEKVDSTDFRTWDLETLFAEIHTHFQHSLANGLILQQTPLQDFNILLNTHKGSKNLRPTLFDFLNHEALNFYKTPENSISKPAFKFEIDRPDYLAPAQTFATVTLNSKDQNSLQLNALKIYQDLTRFHLKDSQLEALVDVDIERLDFVSQHATFQNKDALLIETLKAQGTSISKKDLAALYTYKIAEVYTKQGNTYNAEINSDYRWKTKEAKTICSIIIKNQPNSDAAKKSKALQESILHKTIEITNERFIPTNTYSKLLVSYKNIESITISAYKISISSLEKFNSLYKKEEKLSFIKNLKAEKTWTSTLKNEGDYQQHTTEIGVPQLTNGHYILLATTDADDISNNFAYGTLQVTNLALVEQQEDTQTAYQLVNRRNGEPIENAKIDITYTKDYESYKNYESRTTDKNGKFYLKKYNDWFYRHLKFAVNRNGETAHFGNYYINKRWNDKGQHNTNKAFIFTDRSIYRPGQPLYFKGIVINSKKGNSSVLANEKITATLFDVNNKEVKQLELSTNEFGSVAGEFILPNNGLTGQFFIELDGLNIDSDATSYFSVEEYKRPKFEAQFKPISQTFKVNDTVRTEGLAQAFAGSNITNAKVVYRVHRKVQMPRWYYWYRPWFNSEPQEITFGETTTNNKGEFTINFKALPDLSITASSNPVFNYEVTADVTDINGETHTATTTVNIGYHMLTATITAKETLNKDSLAPALTIETKNLNGVFTPAKGTIKIYKLKAPNRVLRNRPWPTPDYQIIPEDEFIKKYPHEAYGNESDTKQWETGELVFNESFDTQTSKEIALNSISNWASGLYKIELNARDRYNQAVKDVAFTEVYSPKDKTIADNKLLRITTNKDQYCIGDKVALTLGTAANLVVTVAIEKQGVLEKPQLITLNNSKRTLSIPVETTDLGGFTVHCSTAAFNSYLGQSINISVPYPKSDLEIETLSFRDKLQPNTQETWSFTISGAKGDKVSAELLASMYDASLDQFKPHQWPFSPLWQPIYSAKIHNNSRQSFGTSNFWSYLKNQPIAWPAAQQYDQLNWFGLHFGRGHYYSRITLRGRSAAEVVGMVADEIEVEATALSYKSNANLDEVIVTGHGQVADQKSSPGFEGIQPRKNLKETAFFFPQLQTDKAGNVNFSFTTPEALTQWKLQLLAHTKTLESKVTQLEAVTQKELMVTPNVPRFFRQGDQIIISSKIANLSNKTLSGEAQLQLFDALTGKNITALLVNANAIKPFSVVNEGNTQVSWHLNIPDTVNAIQYKVLAKAGNYTDGEQNALPVLSNRMLVTETLAMWVKGNETRTFTLDKLKTPTSSTLKDHQLTLEMTSNPAWYAVQALPYLMEYPYDCNEQIFSRYYANALARHIANSNPKIQEVFNQWRNSDALLSNLEKNQDLKSLLIQETPWLREAENEAEQKKRIALLFDLNKMNNDLQSALRKLEQNQMDNGAWAWFAGGHPNRFITQHIISGFGHLKQLNVLDKEFNGSNNAMLKNSMAYLDAEFVKAYKDLKRYNSKVDLSKDHLSYTQLHYMYMRSFFPEIPVSKEVKSIINYYHTQIKTYWLKRSLYAKGLMALITHRMKDAATANKILKSLKETSITNEELGMYWKSNTASWYWHQAPIETQALLIEAFSEIENDTNTVDNLKIWLLKNKQTNKWETTKATTEAVYALLLQGSDWLGVTDMVDVTLGGETIASSKLENVSIEAGTGYYKTAWNASEIKPEMGEVTLSKKGKGIAWGALYWQYFEDLDNITSAETPLKLKKKIFKKTNTDTGEQISEITKNTKLKVGDLVRVRIELRSDRDMEFLHMKDMRAAGFEPINVLSQYKWQDGLGYYESTKDASTNFFFDYLPKGIYIFEYDLRVNNAGTMSNGITTIQSMYAPEFSSHSEGLSVLVEH